MYFMLVHGLPKKKNNKYLSKKKVPNFFLKKNIGFLTKNKVKSKDMTLA